MADDEMPDFERSAAQNDARLKLLEAYWHLDQTWEGSRSQKARIKKIMDDLLTRDIVGDADKDEMERVAASYWRLYNDEMTGDAEANARVINAWVKQNSRKPKTLTPPANS